MEEGGGEGGRGEEGDEVGRESRLGCDLLSFTIFHFLSLFSSFAHDLISLSFFLNLVTRIFLTDSSSFPAFLSSSLSSLPH